MTSNAESGQAARASFKCSRGRRCRWTVTIAPGGDTLFAHGPSGGMATYIAKLRYPSEIGDGVQIMAAVRAELDDLLAAAHGDWSDHHA